MQKLKLNIYLLNEIKNELNWFLFSPIKISQKSRVKYIIKTLYNINFKKNCDKSNILIEMEN